MSSVPVSIVIVSRDRPDLLLRAVTGVSQLDYDPFELIVVACPAGMDALTKHPLQAQIKQIPFDHPNISEARNLGIQSAAGDIVAFLDDDAVPEPRWLVQLTRAFANPSVAACGGYVIGRNGFSYQWRARSLGTDGFTTDMDVSGHDPAVFEPARGRAIKTEGTNMAVRRDVLADVGGFDPAYAFYMDETDLNMRLARAGHATAIAPLARVHHGFAPSSRRAADRTPRDLEQIGSSTAAFLQRYTPQADRAFVWARHRAEQKRRCLRAMQRGPLGPDDVTRLLRQLDRGYRAGSALKTTPLTPILAPISPFRPFPGRPGAQKVILSGRIWQTQRKFEKAKTASRNGAIVVLYLLYPSIRYHQKRFSDGIWLQIGGIYGKSHRQDNAIRLTSFKKRVASECEKCDIAEGQSS